MKLKKEVASFALAHTTDPAFAIRIIEQFGDEAVSTTPKVTFPSYWVLAKQKGPVKIAAYAARYCDDPETLDLIETKARRITVREALASNPHLGPVTTQRMIDTANARGEWEVLRRIQRRSAQAAEKVTTPEERFAEALDSIEDHLRGYRRQQFYALISELAPERQREAFTQVLDASLRNENDAVISDLISSRYGVMSGDAGLSALVAALGIDPLAQLDAVDPKLQSSALTDLLVRVTGHYGSDRQLLDAEVTQRIDQLVDPKQITIRTSRRGSFKWFTSEAVDLLMKSGRWNNLMVYHELSDEQLAQLVTMTPTEKITHLFALIGHGPLQRPRAEMLMKALPSNAVLRNLDEGYAVLSTVTSNEDPLVAEVLAHAGPALVASYLEGNWSTEGGRVIPDLDQVARLCARVEHSEMAAREITRSLLRSEFPTEYVREVIEHLPFAATQVLREEKYAGYVFERLADTGADLELALDQFSNNSSVPLSTLCATLRRLATLPN